MFPPEGEKRLRPKFQPILYIFKEIQSSSKSPTAVPTRRAELTLHIQSARRANKPCGSSERGSSQQELANPLHRDLLQTPLSAPPQTNRHKPDEVCQRAQSSHNRRIAIGPERVWVCVDSRGERETQEELQEEPRLSFTLQRDSTITRDQVDSTTSCIPPPTSASACPLRNQLSKSSVEQRNPPL